MTSGLLERQPHRCHLVFCLGARLVTEITNSSTAHSDVVSLSWDQFGCQEAKSLPDYKNNITASGTHVHVHTVIQMYLMHLSGWPCQQ